MTPDPYSIVDGAVVDTVAIRDSENKVTFPSSVALNDFIYVPEENEETDADEDTPGEIMFWFCDEVHKQVFFSAERRPWKNEDRFKTKVRSSAVTVQKVAVVPKPFFGDYIGPHGSKYQQYHEPPAGEAYKLLYGHLYYIVAPPIAIPREHTRGAYLVPVDDVVDLVGHDLAQLACDEDITPYLADVEDQEEEGPLAEDEAATGSEAEPATAAAENPGEGDDHLDDDGGEPA